VLVMAPEVGPHKARGQELPPAALYRERARQRGGLEGVTQTPPRCRAPVGRAWPAASLQPHDSPTTAPRQPHYSPVFDGDFLIDGVGEGGKGDRAPARGPTMPLSRKET
jgi:hypothetical protein